MIIVDIDNNFLLHRFAVRFSEMIDFHFREQFDNPDDWDDNYEEILE